MNIDFFGAGCEESNSFFLEEWNRVLYGFPLQGFVAAQNGE